jgi:hypothetical protein
MNNKITELVLCKAYFESFGFILYVNLYELDVTHYIFFGMLVCFVIFLRELGSDDSIMKIKITSTIL